MVGARAIQQYSRRYSSQSEKAESTIEQDICIQSADGEDRTGTGSGRDERMRVMSDE
jgi:hypothetical protein